MTNTCKQEISVPTRDKFGRLEQPQTRRMARIAPNLAKSRALEQVTEDCQKLNILYTKTGHVSKLAPQGQIYTDFA